MSKINKHNYEAYYLDYLEGNLNKEDTTLLFLFLEDNPHLKSGLENFDLIKLEKKQTISFDKEPLKQKIDSTNVGDYIIADLENIIDEEDKAELEEYLNHSREAALLAKRYEKTRLIKPSKRFPDIEQLKKKTPLLYYIAPIASAAAMALLFLLFINQPLAEKDSLAEKQSIPLTDVTGTTYYDIERDNKIVSSEKRVDKAGVMKSDKKIDDRELQQIAENKTENIKPDIDQSNDRTTGKADEKIVLDSVNKTENKEVLISGSMRFQYDSIVENQSDRFMVETADYLPVKQKEERPEEVITLDQWVANNIKKLLFNEERSQDEKIKGSDVLAAVVQTVDRTSTTDIDYNYRKQGNKVSYSFSIGFFEFSRTKNQ